MHTNGYSKAYIHREEEERKKIIPHAHLNMQSPTKAAKNKNAIKIDTRILKRAYNAFGIDMGTKRQVHNLAANFNRRFAVHFDGFVARQHFGSHCPRNAITGNTKLV